MTDCLYEKLPSILYGHFSSRAKSSQERNIETFIHIEGISFLNYAICNLFPFINKNSIIFILTKLIEMFISLFSASAIKVKVNIASNFA